MPLSRRAVPGEWAPLVFCLTPPTGTTVSSDTRPSFHSCERRLQCYSVNLAFRSRQPDGRSVFQSPALLLRRSNGLVVRSCPAWCPALPRTARLRVLRLG